MSLSRALEIWVNDHGEEALLPGLTDFTQTQLFWIRNAHQWCHRYTEDSLRSTLEDIKQGKDNHTPDKYRLIGSLMLSDEFAKDFNCPKNSTMNPSRNCLIGSLWPQNPTLGAKTKIGQQNTSARINVNVVILIFIYIGIDRQKQGRPHLFN